MNVILLENVRKLGKLGESVSVKPGYARNFLFPQGMATRSTEQNRRAFEERRAELEDLARARRVASEERAQKLNGLSITISMRASEEGKLYGSVGNHEILEAIRANGHEASKKEILLPNGPMRSIGDYNIDLQLDDNISATIKVSIVLEA